MHALTAEGPQECDPLFAFTFHGPIFYVTFGITSYMDWLMKTDMGPAYAFYKKELQILGRHFADRHRVLKAPMHLGFTRYLLSNFPDAAIVQTHRDPCEAVPSLCSLVYYLRKLATHRRDPDEIGSQWNELLAVYMNKNIAFREKNNDSFLDVGFRSLVADPIATVREIYGHFGYQYSRDFENAMRSYLSENRRNKHSKHRYSRRQFGLTRTKLKTSFAGYYQRYAAFL